MLKGTEVGSLTASREGSGPASWPETAWHKGKAIHYPKQSAIFDNLKECIESNILIGHKPNAPLLNKDSRLTTIGSCFAAELRHFLSDVNLSSNSFWVPSGLNNTFALRDFISWCATGKETSSGYRYERKSDGSVADWIPNDSQQEYFEHLQQTDAFVFTLGLSEVWEDIQTGKVFWRGIPEQIFETNRHNFRQTTVQENAENLKDIVALIRSINPKAHIIFTLSPVPLKATFNQHSCVTSDCVSKSTLRIAINEAMQNDSTNLWYWPSFEIVKWMGCHLPYPVYGTDDGNVRHVSRHVVIQIIESFINAFYGENIAFKAFENYVPSLKVLKGKDGQPPFIYKGTIVKG